MFCVACVVSGVPMNKTAEDEAADPEDYALVPSYETTLLVDIAGYDVHDETIGDLVDKSELSDEKKKLFKELRKGYVECFVELEKDQDYWDQLIPALRAELDCVSNVLKNKNYNTSELEELAHFVKELHPAHDYLEWVDWIKTIFYCGSLVFIHSI